MLKNNLIKKFLSFSIGGYVNALIGLLTVPIITRILSPEQYGIASLISIIVEMLVVFCSLALDQSFVRFFYEVEEEERGKLLQDCLYYPMFITIFSSLIIFIFRNQISMFILGKKEKVIWIIIVFSIVALIIKSFAFLVVRMQQKGGLYSFFYILIKVVEFSFILLFFKIYGNDYKVIVLATLFSTLITSLLMIVVERKIWRLVGKRRIEKKELLKFSAPLVLTLALTWVFASSDKITIKIFSNLRELGLYSGAFRIVSVISVIQTGFTSFWTPFIYERYSKNPDDLVFYKKANDYLSLIFFLIGITILATRNIIIILLGEKYYDSLFIVPMLIFVPIMYLISETTMMGIGFKKKSKYFLYISIIVAVFNIVGNILLVPKYGAKGAAISTGISYIIFFSLRTYFSLKLINFGFNLKRIYMVMILLLCYALYLSFYNNLKYTILLGGLLIITVLLIYKSVLLELKQKFIKIRSE
ncbi:oligosaccharide flippase family protein [Fusobacterium pseudoperiodonticum]|uniref:Polysaccharide biosynthesis protein n=1 Tax=Fusobacterium pseudoperiodonticum TaxID=2663009 RepID=A0A2D3NWU5_9FUSO|nr:oligosaccharide flippase family protein [Fusobacterium pseudoperiodonticum]ATV59903.1 polysaccharide biosynthesis protein [Fusobacterium pseudoperiodonticum]